MATNLPKQGWLPDPAHPGVIRLRWAGVWTDTVIQRQEPWGAERMIPPTSSWPLNALAS